MKIRREYLGGAQDLDLGTPEGWTEWVHSVVQDEEAAQELAERIEDEGVVVINFHDPEYIERYTKTYDDEHLCARCGDAVHFAEGVWLDRTEGDGCCDDEGQEGVHEVTGVTPS